MPTPVPRFRVRSEHRRARENTTSTFFPKG
jgi:hypothetical protein